MRTRTTNRTIRQGHLLRAAAAAAMACMSLWTDAGARAASVASDSRPGTTNAASEPHVAPVAQLASSTETSHMCAVLTTGRVLCWGNNSAGQLGTGDMTNVSVPMTMAGMTDAVQASIGYEMTCVRRSTGTVACVGNNNYGQLGNDSLISSTAFVTVLNPAGSGPLTGVTQISAGKFRMCAVVGADALCWGRQSNTLSTTLPVTVTGLPSVAQVSVGKNFSCALTTGGSVYCWGYNYSGEFGNGAISTSYTDVPTQVKDAAGTGFLSNVAKVRAGSDQICAVTTANELWCWGDNNYRQIGDGTGTGRTLPVQPQLTGTVSALTNISDSAPGEYHTCHLATSGAVYCSGDNYTGVVGDGTTYPVGAPRAVTATVSNIVDLDASSDVTCALSDVGDVYCWGEGRYGKLGNGDTSDQYLPVKIIQAPPVLSNESRLASLTISPGVLAPAYVSTTTDYTVSLPAGTTAVTVTAVPVHAGAVLTYSITPGSCGVPGPSGAVCTLQPGMNSIEVLVQSEDGGSLRGYYIDIEVPAVLSSDASLLDLTLDPPAVLGGTFVSTTTSYTASAPAGTTLVSMMATSTATTTQGITVTSTAQGSDCSVAFNEGLGSIGCVIDASGVTTITVTVTAQDSATTRQYVVVFDMSTPHLSSLVIDVPGLTPTFVSTTLHYQTEVPSGTNQLVVTPTLSVGATAEYSSTAGACTVNRPSRPGFALQAATCPLFPTQATTVTVGASDGTTTVTYTILATRASAPSMQKLWFPQVPVLR